MVILRKLLLGATLLALFAGALFPQAGGADIAKRTLDSGISFYRSGDYKQALQDFTTVINGYRDSEWVDEALIYMARYYYEVEGDLDQARAQLMKIRNEYAASNSVPEAYFYLGYILFDSRLSIEQMRDGLANFERVVRLFPESDIAADALFQAGRVHIALGEFDNALAKLQQLLHDFPDSALRAEAQYGSGDCFMYLGNVRQAMVEFQQVRNLYSDSPFAEKALDRLTLLYRLYYCRQFGVRQYEVDGSFRLNIGAGLDDPKYLEITSDGRVLLADRGLNLVMTFESGGAKVGSTAARRPEMIKAGPGGEVTILADKHLTGDRPITLVGGGAEPITTVGAFCRGLLGQYYVWDEKTKFVHIFDHELKLQTVLRADEYRDVRDMALDLFSNVYVLDGRERRVIVYDPQNRKIRRIGPTFGQNELRDPTALALDNAGNLYILDRRNRDVYVFDSDGSLLASLSFQNTVDDPRGLAVDASGAVLITDRRRNNVVKFF